ncbi:MAG: cytochrome b N-terminal domain-containing protein, partial [Actinomycetota bacterium]|nr:cytochrome b N-terminal domain-containing protein [Actinomycetota bacterium]
MTLIEDQPISRQPGRARRALDVVDERLGIRALEYPVPDHANRLAWSLGGVTAAAFAILIVTGIIVVQFYNPVPEAANQSVRYLVTQVWGGRLVRGVHFWAAQAMYVTAALHMLRVFLTGSYKRPREANWLVGVAMFGLVTLALFTGTVLKWDQEGFEALGHNLEIGKLLGGAGFWFSPTFAGNVPILTRLYSAHVILIPGLILVLVML